MNGNHNHLPQGRDRDGGTAAPAGVVAACWDHGKLTGIGILGLGSGGTAAAPQQHARDDAELRIRRVCRTEPQTELDVTV
jgi:hypothetical protein